MAELVLCIGSRTAEIRVSARAFPSGGLVREDFAS